MLGAQGRTRHTAVPWVQGPRPVSAAITSSGFKPAQWEGEGWQNLSSF